MLLLLLVAAARRCCRRRLGRGRRSAPGVRSGRNPRRAARCAGDGADQHQSRQPAPTLVSTLCHPNQEPCFLADSQNCQPFGDGGQFAGAFHPVGGGGPLAKVTPAAGGGRAQLKHPYCRGLCQKCDHRQTAGKAAWRMERGTLDSANARLAADGVPLRRVREDVRLHQHPPARPMV